MRRHRVLLVGAAVAVPVFGLLTAGCGGDDATVGFDDLEVVTDDAETVVVERDASFFVELDANPTTGYEWIVVSEPDPAVARVVTVDYVPDTTDEDVMGSGGINRYEVEAVGEGTTTFGLEYTGPSGDDVAETRSFTIEVVPR